MHEARSSSPSDAHSAAQSHPHMPRVVCVGKVEVPGGVHVRRTSDIVTHDG